LIIVLDSNEANLLAIAQDVTPIAVAAAKLQVTLIATFCNFFIFSPYFCDKK